MKVMHQLLKDVSRRYGLFDRLLKTTLIVDIVGSCNLKCPSCPVGGDNLNPGGKMSLELFKEIISHARTEFNISNVALFNWTDPTIYRDLPHFITYLREQGLCSRVSTNLSHIASADRLAESVPDELTISLSGFTNPIYTRGHRGGDVEIVKRNMQTLSQWCHNRNHSMSKFNVYYHIYNYNEHEVEPMRRYALDLGFTFGAGMAYYMPIERALKYKVGRLELNEKSYVESSFKVPIKDILSASSRDDSTHCSIQHTQLVINCRGQLLLCCGVFSEDQFVLGDFLSLSRREIFRLKQDHIFCNVCKSHSLQHYINWYDSPVIKSALGIS